MDKRQDFTGINPDIRLDQILIDAEANRPAMFAMMASLAVGTNPNYIIDGCAVTEIGSPPNVSWAVTAGYIFLNGEILQVESQSGIYDPVGNRLAYSKVTTYDPKGDITYDDGTPRQTWQKNRGIITAQASVSITELDAVSGDTIDDKLKTYIGASSETNEGVVEKATTAEVQAATVDKNVTADNIRSLTSTTSRPGITEKATTAEAQAGTTDKNVTADLLLPFTGGLLTTVIEIGDWDMTVGTATVAHGLTLSKIRSISIMIRRDDAAAQYPLDSVAISTIVGQGGIGSLSTTQITLYRLTGGIFDDANFSATSYNRGWIIIKHTP